ncbi:hypothetical protein ACXYTJ_13365 [Gilvimarinus sp. F26214L]|uniref:hypothetical protein n=1 Tax=Gilvimarinus sp. DZF01 TaxID=3461371 RepID=UPI0040458D1B
MNTRNEPNKPGDKKREVADDLKAKADQTTREMKSRGKEQLEAQESRAADTMDKMAEATQAAARQLEEKEETTLSRYVSEIADGIGSLSSNLRNKNTDELIGEVSRLARNNSGLFLLGSVAVGFGLARIAKANRPDSANQWGEGQEHWEDYYGQQEGRSYGAGSSGSAELERATSSQGTSTSPSASSDSSNPTHASTSYLPEEGESVQSPINPPSGARTDTQSPGGPGRSSS